MAQCAAIAGAGSGASHLVTGHGLEHERLEADLAQFTGRQRALLFSTGYMANLAAVTCLAERDSRVVMDRLSHASLIDAARLSGATLKRFAHADAQAAQAMLAARRDARQQSAGDRRSLQHGRRSGAAAATGAGRHAGGCLLIVDDAHGLGVMGATGRGCLEHFNLDSAAVPILVGTLGKAFGCFGAFIAGDADYIEWLLQSARSYIYTTALPQPVAAAARAALAVASAESWRRERVLELAARLRRGAAQAGVPLLPSPSPIQPVVLGRQCAGHLLVSEQLFAAGFWVAAIRPPTVPRGTARLRITLVGRPQRAAGRRAARGPRGGAARHARNTACSRLIPLSWTAARCVRPSIAPAPPTMRPRCCRRACVMSCCHGLT